MGFVMFGLIAEWNSAVAAYRTSRGTDFYWDVPEADMGRELPFLTESNYLGGYDCVEAGWYYENLRRALPPQLRTAADAFLGAVLHDVGDGCPKPPDDLTDDVAAAGGEPTNGMPYYSMRPKTVQRVLGHARSLPWSAIEEVAERLEPRPLLGRYDIRDIGHFQCAAGVHQAWLEDAADAGRGLIVLTSQ